MHRLTVGLILLALTASAAPAAPPADWIGDFVKVKVRLLTMIGTFDKCADETELEMKTVFGEDTWKASQKLAAIFLPRPKVSGFAPKCEWYQEAGLVIDVPAGEEFWLPYECSVWLRQKGEEDIGTVISVDVTAKLINRVTNGVVFEDTCLKRTYLPDIADFVHEHWNGPKGVCLKEGHYWLTLTSRNSGAIVNPLPVGSKVDIEITPILWIDETKIATKCP